MVSKMRNAFYYEKFYMKWYTNNSSLVAEGLAIREGCQCPWPSIFMESDCLQVIESCRNNTPAHEVAAVVEDIRTMRNWFSNCALLWTPREANQLAHQVAQLSLDRNLPSDWVLRLPTSFSFFWSVDYPPLEIGFWRKKLKTCNGFWSCNGLFPCF